MKFSAKNPCLRVAANRWQTAKKNVGKMKYKFTFFIIIYFFLSSCKNELNLKKNPNNDSQKENIKTEKEKITEIKNNFARINSTKKWTKKIVKEIWESTEGGEATFYYSKNNLEKITEIHYGESGQNLTEYYFANFNLSFIFEKDIHYNRPISYSKEINKEVEDGVYFDFDKSEITEVRSYFYDKKLIRQISSNKSNVKNKVSIKNEYLRLIEKLKFIKKIEKIKE